MSDNQHLPKSVLTTEDVIVVQEICKILSQVLIRLNSDSNSELEANDDQ